jgi:sulfate adenylyltransferase subunit 1
MDILKFITAGNVDDGKSTLIGRLLYETSNIKSDILDSLSRNNQTNSDINLAFLTDGLRAERQQGITIDVAYKYFSTNKRKFIIIDAPGHFQYTKNLVTGASNADVMIILVDVLNGITEQTRRHSLIASFLGIKHIFIAVNKMDLIGYDEQVFIKVTEEYSQIAQELRLSNITYIPISALEGDNVTTLSNNMEWYKGEDLMTLLESVTLSMPTHSNKLRLSIQYILGQHDGNNSQNRYAGKLLSGLLKVGDMVVVHPAGEKATIQKIVKGYEDIEVTDAGDNIVIYLDSDTLYNRGDIVSFEKDIPIYSNEIEVLLCWLDDTTQLEINKEYIIRINGQHTRCTITDILYVKDINSFENQYNSVQVIVNEFAKVKLRTEEVMVYDTFPLLPENGRGIIINPATNQTSGAFIIGENKFD